MSPSILVFTALNCEAKPLIRRWGLKKISGNQPFAIYTGDERAVIVTGMGKVAMAGAVGYTLSLFSGNRQPLLLNIGIAGHRRHPVGSLYLADKVTDRDTGKKFYPQLPFSISVQTGPVETLATPAAAYPGDFLYEMEAAAFYEMAVKFSSSELIHCLKIVSDNELSPLEAINEELVDGWINRHLGVIDNLIEGLVGCRGALPKLNDDVYERLTACFHFTANNAVKLKNCLQRWQLVKGENELNWNDSGAKSGKELIAWLDRQLAETDFYL